MPVWISKIVSSLGLVLSTTTVALAAGNDTSPVTTAETGANITASILLALGVALVVTLTLAYIKFQKTKA
jgi:hypothetical protein